MFQTNHCILLKVVNIVEELRAALQCHCNDDDDNGMEMTEVIHQDITTNIPVIQACHTY